MKIFDVCVEVVVHFYLVGVEFKFRRIQKRFGAGEPGNHHVELFDEVKNIRERSVRHRGGYVAGYRVGQSGFHVRLREFLIPGAFSLENISVTLNENMSVGEHVRQFAYLFRVLYGLIERIGEVVRAENGKVGVVGFFILERVTVDDGEIVVVIFLRHVAAGILAERSHFVFERSGVADEFRFV